MVLFGHASASVGIFIRTALQHEVQAAMMGRMASLLRLCTIVGSTISIAAVVGTSTLMGAALQLAMLGFLLVAASLGVALLPSARAGSPVEATRTP
jgi:hypothetical protein